MFNKETGKEIIKGRN